MVKDFRRPVDRTEDEDFRAANDGRIVTESGTINGIAAGTAPTAEVFSIDNTDTVPYMFLSMATNIFSGNADTAGPNVQVEYFTEDDAGTEIMTWVGPYPQASPFLPLPMVIPPGGRFAVQYYNNSGASLDMQTYVVYRIQED